MIRVLRSVLLVLASVAVATACERAGRVEAGAQELLNTILPDAVLGASVRRFEDSGPLTYVPYAGYTLQLDSAPMGFHSAVLQLDSPSLEVPSDPDAPVLAIAFLSEDPSAARRALRRVTEISGGPPEMTCGVDLKQRHLIVARWELLDGGAVITGLERSESHPEPGYAQLIIYSPGADSRGWFAIRDTVACD